MAKTHPERVIPRLALKALRRAGGDRKAAWSRYVQEHFQATGSVTPGCDARDLFAWLDEHTEQTGSPDERADPHQLKLFSH